MAGRSRQEPGFDVRKAIRALHVAAVAARAFPPRDRRAKKAHLVATAHLHGIEQRRSCTRNPCRLAGLCLALFEVLQYERERKKLGPVLDAADTTEEAMALLVSARDRHATTVKRLNRYANRRKTKWENRSDRDGRRRLQNQARSLVPRFFELLTEVDTLARALLAVAWSPQHRQTSRRKRSDMLLTAVWQHLDWGGLTYTEIYELVPSLAVVEDVKDVVRKRVANANPRSLMPRELHPQLREEPKVEKHHRRRSST